MGESSFARAVAGIVIDAGEATYATSGSNLDFAVVCRSLAQLCSVHISWQIPWRPLAAVFVRLAWFCMQLGVPKLRLYRDVPLLPGPRLPWSTFERENVQLNLRVACPRHQLLDGDLSLLFGTCMAQAEGWLQSVETDIDINDVGRGVHVAFTRQPLSMTEIQESRLWKHPHLEYGQMLGYWIETFQRHSGFSASGNSRLRGNMFHLIIRAATKVETWRVAFAELHFDMACKFKSLLYKIGPLNLDALVKVIHDIGLQKHWFLKALLKERAEQWTAIVQDMVKGSGQVAFAYFKSDEAVAIRPFRDLLVSQRAEARRSFWKARGGEATSEQPWPSFKLLETLAAKQVESLNLISSVQIVETLKGMPNKKGGPDGCTFRLLTMLPRLVPWYSFFMTLNVGLFHNIEQFLLVHVACLPKDVVCERPICLTHVLYRLWCKLRKPLVDHWLLNDRELAFWDQAVKGSTCLQVALLRLCKAEVCKKLALKQISLLVDLTNFYDLVDHDLLAADALALGFPPLILFMCLQVHKGPRILIAEDLPNDPVNPMNGILADCPFGVVLAKIVLWTLMFHVNRVCKPQGLTTWVDDIGIGVRGFSSGQVAQQAVNAFLELREGLVARGLEVNVTKSGFLVGDVAIKKALKCLLDQYQDCPQLKDTIKDLGIDNSLARKRRLGVHHSRLKRGRARLAKVKHLPVKSRKKFVNMSANSVAMWGHMALGVPPNKLRARRLNVVRTNKWVQGRGSLEVAMQIHAEITDDPYYRLRVEQLRLWFQLVRRCGTVACSALSCAWEQSWSELLEVKYRWQIVKSP